MKNNRNRNSQKELRRLQCGREPEMIRVAKISRKLKGDAIYYIYLDK